MATSTLAKSPVPHQLFTETVRPFAPASYPKPQSRFRVFATGEAAYHWRVVALATSRTISRHKSLSLALGKCIRLNDLPRRRRQNETK